MRDASWISRFLAYLLMIGALLPAAPATAAERLSGSGWTLSLSMPKGNGPFPAVILLPGCSGNGPAAVAAGLRDHVRQLTAGGYAAGILDVLGGRSICADLAALGSREQSAARSASAAARQLGADPRIDPKRLGFIGQSFGGSVALRLAASASPFKAIVAYYPWCRGGGARVPTLIMTGDADTWTPVSRCRGMGAQVVTYPGAVHSFDLKTLKPTTVRGVGGDFPVAGNAAAASASQARFLSFFSKNLR